MSSNKFNGYSLMTYFKSLKSFTILILSAILFCQQLSFTEQTNVIDKKSYKKEFNRRTIVFDIKTPKVFYCPQEKQSEVGKMIVKAKPLDRLCEFDGKIRPKKSPIDCYNDVDETDFACEEKKRFLLRLDANQELTTTTSHEEETVNGSENGFIIQDSRKKRLSSGKKYWS